MLFRDDLAAGRLVSPFETRLASGYGYYLVTAPEDLDEAVALFRSWLIRRFAEVRPWPRRTSRSRRRRERSARDCRGRPILLPLAGEGARQGG